MHAAYIEAILAAVAGLLSWALTGGYLRMMRAPDQLAIPNERSMHKTPVPVGAGLVIVGTAAVLWLLWPGADLGMLHVVLLAGFAGLSALSWVNDRRALSASIRLSAQGVAVVLCLSLLPADARVLPALPLVIERLVLGVAWVWFINLFNFMDGIDGLAGSETIAIALGYLFILSYVGLEGPLWRLALVTASATAGYLVWNWNPAKVFMGDAGSIPLGFVLGWLMIDLASHGQWPAALILPSYFAVDATLTLLRRTLRGESPVKAHREHFYQRAVLGGLTASAVVCRVSIANATLIGLALLSVDYPLLALLAAVAVVAGLLAHLQGAAGVPQVARPTPSNER